MHPQRFSTGLQTRKDWHPRAQFIGWVSANTSTPTETGTQDAAEGAGQEYPLLRSDAFTVTDEKFAAITGRGASVSALLTVASLGWHEVYLNGHRLEDASVLIPSVSDMHHRVLSHQYDTGGYLVQGSNVLAFWAAPGWTQLSWHSHGGGAGTSFNVTAAPLVMAQLMLCDTSCSLLVATDTAWKARPSWMEHTGAWQWGNYGGEKIDWSQYLADWSTAPAPASNGWVAATALPVDKAVTPESLEAMAVVETLPATGIAPCEGKTSGTCFVVSFPRLFNGFFSASSLPGLSSGQSATFTYSANCLSPCPQATPYMPCAPPTSGNGVCSSAAPEWVAVDTLVTGSCTDGTSFANKFNWHTFQFVTIEVTGSSGGTLKLSDADLSKFMGSRITNAQEKVGAFTSSSTMLNSIYDAFVQTYEGLTVSGMQVDCTNRERLGYGGDAHTRIEFAMDTYASHALYSKWLTDWRDTQLVGPVDDKESPHVFGNVPNTAPTYSGSGSPMWGGITVLLPYELYRRYGDMRMLEASYPMMRDFLSFMVHFSANTTDGLVQGNAQGFDWLGDWQAPHGCSDGNDPDLYNNAYIVYALRRAVEVIGAIDNETIATRADSARFAAAAERIGAGVHRVFFRAGGSCYGPSTPGTAVARQGHQVLALVAGLTPHEQVPAVLASLVRELTNSSGAAKGHIDTGTHTTYFMGKILSGGMDGVVGADADRADLIYRAAMNPTWPSYSALISAGLTTWPETWGIKRIAGGVSKMHGTLNGFGLTFPQSFLGVTLPFASLASITPGSGLQIRPSYFISGVEFPPPPLPPPPPPGPAPRPPTPAPPVVPPAACVDTMEGTTVDIGCPTGQVISSIMFASFGTPTGSCTTGFKADATCNSSHSVAVVSAACVGKQTCKLDASCNTFHEKLKNPGAFCWATTKYLAVKVACKTAVAAPPSPPAPAPPLTIPALTAVRGTVRTLHGAVGVSWADVGTTAPVILNISIPIGASNTSVWIVGKADTVMESGKPAAVADGVRLLRATTRHGQAYSVWAVGSGTYFFSSHR